MRRLGVGLGGAPLAAWALASALTIGCALTGKSDALDPRYFTPERTSDLGARATPRPGAAPVDLRLGRVRGASHLEERLVFRSSQVELGYYAERRWTEAPEEYLRRRLERVLFEERGMRQVVGGTAPTLELELTAFEEIRAPAHVARVQLVADLHDTRFVRWVETVTVERPVTSTRGGDDAADVVAALGAGLRAAVDQVADRVAHELASPAVPAAASAEPAATTRPSR